MNYTKESKELRMVQVICDPMEILLIEETLQKSVDTILMYFNSNMTECSITLNKTYDGLIKIEFKAKITKDDTENSSRKG